MQAVTLEGHRNENLKYLDAMADLLFAYINKDLDVPHVFEMDAVKAALEILKAEYQGTKYTEAFFIRCERIITDNEGDAS